MTEDFWVTKKSHTCSELHRTSIPTESESDFGIEKCDSVNHNAQDIYSFLFEYIPLMTGQNVAGVRVSARVCLGMRRVSTSHVHTLSNIKGSLALCFEP
jgi:hypothetical protein